MLRPWKVAVAGALLTFWVSAIWAVATPLFASPDEDAHAVRAAATATGDPAGRPYVESGLELRSYRVPEAYEKTGAIVRCSALQPNVPADCGPPFVGEDWGRQVSAASNYPPLYYWLVGWPAALSGDSTGLYLMRLVSALLCALMVSAGCFGVACAARGVPALLGPGLAVTPMVVFLGGTVNPNALEIAAAVGLWGVLIGLLSKFADPSRAQGTDRETKVLAAMAVGCGVVLSNMRPLSPAMVVAIVGLAWLATPALRLRDLARRPLLVGTLAALGVTVVYAALMVLRSGVFDDPLVGGHSLGPARSQIRAGIGFTDTGLRQMVGVFGWLDTGTAQLSYYMWLLALGALLVAALVVGSRRRLLGLGATVLLTLALPALANARQDVDEGFIWQGRYSLPLAVGIALLAATSVDAASSAVPVRVRVRGVAVVASAAAIGHLYAVYWATRRFAVGVDGPILFFTDPDWTPPVPALVLLVGTAALVSAGAASLILLAARQDSTGAERLRAAESPRHRPKAQVRSEA